MKNTIRTVLASILGIIIAFMVIKLTERLSAYLFPAPHPQPTIQQYIDYVQQAPLALFLINLLGYKISSFLGAYTAARIAHPPYKMRSAMIVGFMLLLAGIVLFISIPHPHWVALSSCVSFILYSYMAGRIAGRV